MPSDDKRQKKRKRAELCTSPRCICRIGPLTPPLVKLPGRLRVIIISPWHDIHHRHDGMLVTPFSQFFSCPSPLAWSHSIAFLTPFADGFSSPCGEHPWSQRWKRCFKINSRKKQMDEFGLLLLESAFRSGHRFLEFSHHLGADGHKWLADCCF